jgi:spore coat protein A
MDIGQFTDQLHPDLPNPTRLWGFGQGGTFKHLSGILATKRGDPVQITFRNSLPRDHILPVDRTIMGVEGNQDNRTDVHLHGGRTPWVTDGGPHAWWDPDGHVGPSFLNNAVLRAGQTVPPNEAEYYYPNDQGSRLLWYHDHVFGLTRLNAYAGLASAYVIYDDYELALEASGGLPGPLDPRTVYLIVQDKVFVRSDIESFDPSWPLVVPASRPGDLWYAHVYEPGRWDLDAVVPPQDPSVIPEFFGDTMLVNGTVYPTLEVEQRQYRFRFLNACNARFLNPRFVYARGATFPDDTEPSAVAGPPFVQIGTEGGFLPYPAMVNAPGQVRLLLAPAERADVIVDFRDAPVGATFILANDAPAPFPMGDDRDDFFRSSPVSPRNVPGYGPDTRALLQIRVKARVGPADAPISLPARFTPPDPFAVEQAPGVPTQVPSGVPVRRLTLNEGFDELGRLIQFLGTDVATNGGDEGPGFGRPYLDAPTEVIPAGSTEVWEIVNLTGDTHPIHFHLVNVQILSRQGFSVSQYSGGAPKLQGKPTAPDPNELGWKETVRSNPGEVIRVLMTFDVAAVPFTVPVSPRLQAEYGISGAEYVWHCHILEHEEHDMMRPLVVV